MGKVQNYCLFVNFHFTKRVVIYSFRSILYAFGTVFTALFAYPTLFGGHPSLVGVLIGLALIGFGTGGSTFRLISIHVL